MIDGLKPYPVMKDSGVEWLGAVPAHWGVQRLKSVSHLIMGQSPPSENCSVERVGLPFLQGCAEFGPEHPRPQQYCRKPAKVSPRGAILLSVRAPVGKFNFADQPYAIGRGLCAVIPESRRLDTAFAYFGLGVSTPGLTLLSTGSTYDAVSVGDVANLPTIVPPLSEQTTIIRFLDHADRRIRRYISAKEKLIALLEEQKQAVIHHAITGRIDVRTGKPYPVYKPSGVEQLGRVPEHWEVRKLGQCGMISKGSGGSKEDELSEGVPCVRYGDLYTTHEYVVEKSRSCISMAKTDQYTAVKYGDVLFAASGETIDEIGKSAVNLIQEMAYCGGDIILFRPAGEFDARYLGYLTDCPAAINQKATMGRGITVMHIYRVQLKKLTIPVAPLLEQTAIAHFLDDTTAKIDKGIADAQSEVNLIHEYRTRLITDVVTGKVDVREAATALPKTDPLTEDNETKGGIDVGSEGGIHLDGTTLKEARP